MKFLRNRSLRSRLTIRLVLIQGIGVVLSAMLAMGAIILLYDTTGTVSDPRDSEIISDALDWDAAGNLYLRQNDAVRELLGDHPNLWFVAADTGGSRIVYGTVPQPYLGLADIVTELNTFGLRTMVREPDLSAFLRVTHDRPYRLHILLGNVGQIDVLRGAFVVTNQFMMMLFVVLAIVTIAIIPWIIYRETRGVQAVADQVDKIDIEKRGMQLTQPRLPTEIESLVNAFNAALQRIDRGYLQQQRFLAAAAHELKTPISILATRIETTVNGPERQQLVQDVARLGTVAEQLLDVQRLEQAQGNRTVFDLVETSHFIVADMAPLAIGAGYDIEFASALGSYEIQGDRGAIERAMINLVQNAIVHGNGRGTIDVEIESDGTFSVTDEGPGIADEHKPLIFDPFYRVRPMRQGSGLGLSLVRSIVIAHQGTMGVKDTQHQGARFYFWIPSAAQNP